MNSFNLDLQNQKAIDFIQKAGIGTLLNHLDIAIYCCDADANIVYFNEKAVEVWGRRPNEGEAIEKFCGSYKIYKLDGSFLPNDKCPMAVAIQQKLPVHRGEIIIERPDNSWVFGKPFIKALYDANGEYIGAINSIADVSIEKRLTNAHEQMMENFRFLADNIPQLVWMANAEGSIDYYNNNWSLYTGLSYEELRIHGWKAIVHKEDIPKMLRNWYKGINQNQLISLKLRIINSKNEYRWFLVRAIPRINSNNQTERWFGTCTDIDDQIGINEKLEKANLDLSKINNHLDTFIYTASHDLKSPISNIEGLINTLSYSLKDGSIHQEEINHTLSLIQSSINKFKITINDLTEIARIEKIMEGQADIEVIEIEKLFVELMEELAESIKISNAKVFYNFDNNAFIRFSRVNFKSIIYNLLSNSIKYRNPDKELHINVISGYQNGRFFLSVEDNGLGIKESVTDKLFLLFKRFHTHVEGSGMGLYIVKRIIDNSNGEIKVESKEGAGSKFTIIL